MGSFTAALVVFVMFCLRKGMGLPRILLLARKCPSASLSALINDWSRASKALTLIIVESPAKARTIQSFVDTQTNIVDFSAGHIRDLSNVPGREANDISLGIHESLYSAGLVHKDQQMVCPQIHLKASSLGIDVRNGFKPHYVDMPGKEEVIRRLQRLSKKATRIILATDEDREGEAISWHLTEVLKPTVPYKRAVFHEVTRDAILKAFENPRDIDMNLVRAQETRRVLDRLAGFTVSPILWRYVAPGLSAGRVQSCGLHSITERERSRWRFVPSSYCSLSVLLDYQARAGGCGTLLARLQSVDSRKVATEKDFDSATGELRRTAKADDLVVLDEANTTQIGAWLSGKTASKPTFTVTDVDVRKISRKPPQPFITSSLQQEASKKHGFSPARTMSIAQGLYEKGHITYMRTDSYTLSSAALDVCRKMVAKAFGADYLVGTANAGRKSKPGQEAAPKNAQEAHEAIRPAEVGGAFALPEALDLSAEEHTLYSLILRRTLASVMAPSQAVSNTYTILASEQSAAVVPGRKNAPQGRGGSKEASAQAVLATTQALQLSSRRDWTGAGGTAAAESDGDAAGDDGDDSAAAFVDGIRASRHHTRPPARFTEAAFIQEMEELGVGRPSTYSAIFQVLKERGYVVVDKQTVIPTVKGMVVSAFLEKYFPQFVDAQFTAEMERNLDLIAQGERDQQDFLRRFYLHNPDEVAAGPVPDGSQIPAGKPSRETIMKKGLLPAVAELFANEEVDHAETRALEVAFLQDLGVLILSRDTVLFESYDPANITAATEQGRGNVTSLSPSPRRRSGRRWTLPDEMQGDMRQITPEGIRSLMQTPPKSHTVLGEHPETGLPLSFKIGPYGPYVHMGSTKKDTKFFSVPKWVREETFTLEDAVQYASLPRKLGKHPELDAQVILDAQYGDLVLSVKGYTTKVTLPPGTVLGDVTFESASALLPSADEIKGGGSELGRWKGVPVTVCKGPFGVYVRCGKTAASLGSALTAENTTLEMAIHLLSARGRTIGSKVNWKARNRPSGAAAASPQSKLKAQKAAAADTQPDPKPARKKTKSVAAHSSEVVSAPAEASVLSKTTSTSRKKVATNNADAGGRLVDNTAPAAPKPKRAAVRKAT